MFSFTIQTFLLKNKMFCEIHDFHKVNLRMLKAIILGQNEKAILVNNILICPLN